VYTLASVAVVSLTALLGIVVLLASDRLLPSVVTYLVSFAAGALFGDAFLHLLPETAAEYGFDARTGLLVLAGLLLAFVVETYLSWHHHHTPSESHAEPLSYMILFGDLLHNLLDGVVIAASYLAALPVGIATTTAVLFHEIPQEIGDVAVLLYGGMSRRRALAFNLLTALSAFVGAGMVLLARDAIGDIDAFLLPLTAGNFIYIAGSDLIPALREEGHATAGATLRMGAFVLGIAVLYLLTFVG